MDLVTSYTYIKVCPQGQISKIHLHFNTITPQKLYIERIESYYSSNVSLIKSLTDMSWIWKRTSTTVVATK